MKAYLNKDVNEILTNARSVKGENFVKFVKFTGIVHAFCNITINNAVMKARMTEEEFMDFADDGARLVSIICEEYAASLGLSDSDIDEALTLVEQINDRIKQSISH